MEFPAEILAIIRDFSKPLTRPDWKTAKGFTKYKLKYYLNRINPRNQINLNKIINPRYFTIEDLPFKVNIGMIFNYKQNLLEIIHINKNVDDNKKDTIICKNQNGILFNAIIHPHILILSNGNEAVHEIIYINKHQINTYDFI